MSIAIELPATHISSVPVVDEQGDFIGFISEFGILRALEAEKDLNRLTAEDVMAKDRIVVTEETSIDEAVNAETRAPEERHTIRYARCRLDSWSGGLLPERNSQRCGSE